LENDLTYLDVNKITVFKLNERVDLFIRPDCNSFETNLKDYISRFSLVEKKEMKDYIVQLNKYKKVGGNNNLDIDVRKKILIFHNSGEVDTICSNDNDLYFYKNCLWELK
jgi:hypothetical protein